MKGNKYRSFKGKLFEIVEFGENARTRELMLAYRSVDPEKPKVLFVSINDFFAEVMWKDGQFRPRFMLEED